jgi:alpha-L-rhamnosidase
MTRKAVNGKANTEIDINETPVIDIEGPTFDHHHSGFGIQTQTPRLSWRFLPTKESSAIQDWVQTAHELELCIDGGTAAAYVQSSQSSLVTWPKDWPQLQSRDRGSVRVRCHGTFLKHETTCAAVTAWSSWAIFEVALLQNRDWTAHMITADHPVETNVDGSARPLRFSRIFNLPVGSSIRTARLYITSFGVYHVRINNNDVGDQCMAPGWQSYSTRLHYQVFDVADLLTSDSLNVVQIDVGPGWYASALTWASRRFTFGNELGVIAQLEIEFDEPSQRLTITTDSSWSCCYSPITSSEIYNGEIYDSSTEAAASDGLLGTRVISRSLPQLISPEAPPVRVTQRLCPKEILVSSSGKNIIDFGQNFAGRIRLTNIKKPSGHQIILRHAEVMINGELVTRQLRGAKATDVLVCNGSTIAQWHPKFTFHGFRYVEVTGWSTNDEDHPLTTDNIEAEVLHCDLKRIGWFTSGNEEVNRLHENALWGMRSNFLSVPTDDPQRDERLGWTGDLNIFSSTACCLYNVTGMLGSWLQDLYNDQMDDDRRWRRGVVPLVVPNCIKRQSGDGDDWGAGWDPMPNGVWGDAAIMVPWELFLVSGDLSLLSRQWPSMVAYLEAGVDRGYDKLWNPSVWQFGDWLDPCAPANDSGRGRTDGTFVADCYLLHSTSLLSRIASLLNHQDDAERLEQESVRLRKTFQAKYITPVGLLAADTPTAYALALTLELFPPHSKATAVDRLIHHLRLNDFQVSTGFVGTRHILPALTANNRADAAYTMLLSKSIPSFLYPVRMGATTIWERWDALKPDGSVNEAAMTSFNHYALGSVVNWFYTGMAGMQISPIERGLTEPLRLVIRPHVHHAVGHCEAALETRTGRAEVSWRLYHRRRQSEHFFSHELEDSEPDLVNFSVLVPPNAKAEVHLPGELLIGHCRERFARGSVAEFGSGRYTFTCRYEQQGEWPMKPLLPPWGRASF